MNKRERFSTVILILVMVTGVGLLLYPTISDYWNATRQTRAIANYEERLTQYDEADYSDIWKAAQEYNQKLVGRVNRFTLSEEENEEYKSLLDVDGNGIMGYVNIPSISCTLPIYHGVDDAVLQIAIGHIAGSSLPVGGSSTHTLISGHRGLPSAKLFTNLDMLVEGDIFTLEVLDQTLTYEVDQILIVEPEETKALKIEEGKDYCTLITCTPYGVNSHRLLVRGTRIENLKDMTRVAADAQQIDTVVVASVIATIILLVLILMLFNKKKR